MSTDKVMKRRIPCLFDGDGNFKYQRRYSHVFSNHSFLHIFPRSNFSNIKIAFSKLPSESYNDDPSWFVTPNDLQQLIVELLYIYGDMMAAKNKKPIARYEVESTNEFAEIEIEEELEEEEPLEGEPHITTFFDVENDTIP